MVLTFDEWKERHSNSPKYAKLTKEQKRRRYNDYLQSMRSPGGSGSSHAGISSKAYKAPGPRSTVSAPFSTSAGTKVSALRSGRVLSMPINPRTHDLLTARSNPWCTRIRQVGYPVNVPAGSVKWNARARGTLQCNAAGFGYIMVAPGYSGWPDTQSISYSAGAAYAAATDVFPSSFSPTGSATTGMAGAPSTFASISATPAQVTSTWVRLLALGVKVRSNAALLNKAGSIKTVAAPFIDADILAFTGANLLQGLPMYTKWFQANEADSPWYSALFSPAYPGAVAGAQNGSGVGLFDTWQLEGGVMSVGSIDDGIQSSATMGILISGAPNAVFDYDVSGWYEAFGSAFTGVSFLSPTFSDPPGLSAISDVTASIPLNAQQQTTEGSASAASVISGLSSAVKAVAGNSSVQGYISSFLGSLGGAKETVSSEPILAPSLEGSLADFGLDQGSTIDDLTSRLAALKLPSVPSSAGEAEGVGEALSLLGEFAAL